MQLSSADVRLMTFLPYDLARLSGEPGLFLGANVFGQILSHVRFGSKADILQCKRHVRFTPESGHKGTHGDGSVTLIPAVKYTGGVAGVGAGLMPCLTSWS